MKLFTAEGFSFALQVTSLILLIGYNFTKSKDNVLEISKPKASEIYPSYFKTKNEDRLYEFPYLHTEIPKNSEETVTKSRPVC